MGPPRGRPRKDCDWVDGRGWVKRAGAAQALPPSTAYPAARRTVIAQPIDVAALRKAQEEAAERARQAEEDAKARAIAEQERVVRERRAREEEERLAAPRRYALQLQYDNMRYQRGGKACPVYYFDTHNRFCELHKEEHERAPAPVIVKKKKKKKGGLRWVYGPRMTKGGEICAGECELVSDSD